MSDVYVTVGQRYARDPHPIGLHPDGVLLLRGARDEMVARGILHGLMGNQWAFLYTPEEMERAWSHFPRGVTHVVDATVHTNPGGGPYVCGQETPRVGFAYRCTRPLGHAGRHEAHGVAGVIDKWE